VTTFHNSDIKVLFRRLGFTTRSVIPSFISVNYSSKIYQEIFRFGGGNVFIVDVNDDFLRTLLSQMYAYFYLVFMSKKTGVTALGQRDDQTGMEGSYPFPPAAAGVK